LKRTGAPHLAGARRVSGVASLWRAREIAAPLGLGVRKFDSLAPARSALSGLWLRHIPFAASHAAQVNNYTNITFNFRIRNWSQSRWVRASRTKSHRVRVGKSRASDVLGQGQLVERGIWPMANGKGVRKFDSLAPARSALSGLWLRHIPFAASQAAQVTNITNITFGNLEALPGKGRKGPKGLKVDPNPTKNPSKSHPIKVNPTGSKWM